MLNTKCNLTLKLPSRLLWRKTEGIFLEKIEKSKSRVRCETTRVRLDFNCYGPYFVTEQTWSSPPRQTEIEYGTVLGGTTMDFFSKSTIPTYNRMWEFMVARRGHVFVNSTSEGVHRVRSTPGGRYAFLVESPIAEYAETRYYDQLWSVKSFCEFSKEKARSSQVGRVLFC